MRFVHLADIHIGSTYRGKELFSWQRFEKIINKIIELSPDFVLISGDLFDKPIINPEDFFKAYSLLKKLKKKDIPIFTIEGNHDYNNIHLTYYDILSKLNIINNLSSGDKIAFLKDKYDSEYVVFKEINIQNKKRYFAYAEINDKKIFGMAYLRTKESINYFLPKYYREGDIMMIHQSVSRISGIPEEYCELNLSELMKLNFYYFALGHIHNSNFGNHYFNGKIIVYSGSIDMTSKKEFHKINYEKSLNLIKQKKGFIFVEGKEINFLEIESQNFFDINLYFNSIQELKEKIEKIKEIVKENKVILNLNSDYNFKQDKIRELIEDFNLIELKLNFLEQEEENLEFKEDDKIEEIINKFIAYSKIAKDRQDLKNKVLMLLKELNNKDIQKNLDALKGNEEIKISEVKKIIKNPKRNILDFLKDNNLKPPT